MSTMLYPCRACWLARQARQAGQVGATPAEAADTFSRQPLRLWPFTSHLSQRRASKQPLHVCAAKKKKGGGAQKKPPGLLDQIKPQVPWQQTSVIMHTLLLVESYRRQVGEPIMEDVEIADAAQSLFEAPFAVMSHDRGATEGIPKYVYANQAALDLFEATWDEFVGMESHRTAPDEPEAQAEHEKALESVSSAGSGQKFQGKRQGLKGRPVWLEDAVLWNIEGPSGKVLGQAIAISAWKFEDGTTGGPAAEPSVPSTSADGASAEEQVAAAEAAVQEQAEAVRTLKESKGLTNADPEVKAAVAELLDRKGRLEGLQKWAAAQLQEAASAS